MSGNGTDTGHIVSMLQQVIVSQAEQGRRLEGVASDVAGLKQDVAGLKQDVASLDRRMGNVEADVRGLRQAVTDYHASVLGHGFLLSELDDRVRRIERHLDLPPRPAA